MRVRRFVVLSAFGLMSATVAGSAIPAAVGADPPPLGWNITDLGLLGGSFGHATAVNESGAVAGTSNAENVGSRAFMWSPELGLVDLDPLGLTDSIGVDINESGQVVGQRGTPQDSTHAFAWSLGAGIIDLGTLGGSASYAFDINDAGQAVGRADAVTGAHHAYIWSAGTGMTDLGTLGGTASGAVSLNDAGQVTGWSESADGTVHAFVWSEAGGMIDLGIGSGTSSYAGAINEAGQVVGTIQFADYSTHAFVWSAGSGMTDLGAGGGVSSSATGISASGVVAGNVTFEDHSTHAFRWTQATGMVQLGGLGSWSNAISDTGLITGEIATPDSAEHAFIWSSTGMTDLGTLGGLRSEGWAINGAGQVAGWSDVSGYYPTHPVLWTPPGVASVPASPTDASAVQSGGDVSVTWMDNSSNETSFVVLRARWNGSSWSEWTAFTTPADATSLNDAGLPDGQYAYLVRAVNGAGVSNWSTATIVHSTAVTLPAAPTGLAAASAGSDVHLAWTDTATNELGFDVMRSRWVAGSWEEWTSWSADIDAATFTDTALPDGIYAYLVRSRNGIGESEWSVTVIEHSTSATPPEAPSEPFGENVGSDVWISWVDNSTNELLFEVGRARYNPTTQVWGEWTFWTADRNATDSWDSGLPDGRYAYLIRARNSSGASPWTTVVLDHSTSSAPPAAPTGLTPAVVGGRVELSWIDTANDEFFFEVERAHLVDGAWTEWVGWTLDRNTVNFTDSAVTPGHYAYLVRAQNPNGSSDWTVAETTVVGAG